MPFVDFLGFLSDLEPKFCFIVSLNAFSTLAWPVHAVFEVLDITFTFAVKDRETFQGRKPKLRSCAVCSCQQL